MSVPALKAGSPQRSPRVQRRGVNRGRGVVRSGAGDCAARKGNCSTPRCKGAKAQRGVGHKGAVQRSAGRVGARVGVQRRVAEGREAHRWDLPPIMSEGRPRPCGSLEARFTTNRLSACRLSTPSTTSPNLFPTSPNLFLNAKAQGCQGAKGSRPGGRRPTRRGDGGCAGGGSTQRRRGHRERQGTNRPCFIEQISRAKTQRSKELHGMDDDK